MTAAKHITFTERDIQLLTEINRLGIANATEIAFATGDFSGDLVDILGNLLQCKAITLVPTLKVTTYSITGCGLEVLYWESAFVKAIAKLSKKSLFSKIRLFRLRQNHVCKIKP